jgi:hypothetical protein
MAEATKYVFTHQELVEALIKQQGLHEGIWSLTVEFALGVASTGSKEGDLNPTAMIPLLSTGISRTKELTNLAVDASVVNPAPSKTHVAKTK